MATMLLASLLLLALMGADSRGPAAAIMIGAVVCCAASLGGDLLQDLKTGHMVGATPWKQQTALAAGVLVSVFVMAPILNLLLHAYGIGVPTPEHPHPLVAPQATLMASVAQGVFRGGLPWGMVGAGAAIGVAIIIVDEWLRRRGSSIRTPVLAVAVGLYLPLEVNTPIFAGGLIAWAAQRSVGKADSGAGNGTLFAAGLITGEALVGILLAVPIVFTGSTDVFSVPEAWRPGALAGLRSGGARRVHAVPDRRQIQAIGEEQCPPTSSRLCEFTNVTPSLKEYAQRSADLVHEHGGKYIVRSKPVEDVEGDKFAGKSMVIVEFPTMEQLQRLPQERGLPEEREAAAQGDRHLRHQRLRDAAAAQAIDQAFTTMKVPSVSATTVLSLARIARPVRIASRALRRTSRPSSRSVSPSSTGSR